jgi:predicted phosphodiesterase
VEQPEVVTLCGSVRFAAEFLAVHRRFSLDGCIVLLPALPAPDDELSSSDVEALGALHRRKIDMSDRVHIVNPGGYVGQSAAAEIEYAKTKGLTVTFEHHGT